MANYCQAPLRTTPNNDCSESNFTTNLIFDKARSYWPTIPPIIPVCKSMWWQNIKFGQFPQPITLIPRVMAWRAEGINEPIQKIMGNKQ